MKNISIDNNYSPEDGSRASSKNNTSLITNNISSHAVFPATLGEDPSMCSAVVVPELCMHVQTTACFLATNISLSCFKVLLVVAFIWHCNQQDECKTSVLVNWPQSSRE
jgi:hypothetical protein